MDSDGGEWRDICFHFICQVQAWKYSDMGRQRHLWTVWIMHLSWESSILVNVKSHSSCTPCARGLTLSNESLKIFLIKQLLVLVKWFDWTRGIPWVLIYSIIALGHFTIMYHKCSVITLDYINGLIYIANLALWQGKDGHISPNNIWVNLWMVIRIGRGGGKKPRGFGWTCGCVDITSADLLHWLTCGNV